MKQPAKRKQAKKVRRRKRVETRQKKAIITSERKENSIKFSVAEYDKNVVSNNFVSEVLTTLRDLRLNDRRFFSKQEEDFWKLVKKHGFQERLDFLLKDLPYENRNLAMHNYLMKIGTIVFSILKQKNKLLQYIPYNDVVITPVGDEFKIIFDALLRHKTEWGYVYYSQLKPKIIIDDNEYIVAFSRHAVERISERCVGQYDQYAGAGDAFAFLSDCLKFDVIPQGSNGNRNYLITFYEMCAPGYSTYGYLEGVKDDVNDYKEYRYRVGYCPISLSEGFASSKTLLTPGMRGTPEDFLLKKSDLEKSEEIEIRKSVERMIMKKIWAFEQDFSAIKWFHDNGVPQVMEIDEPLFNKDKHKLALDNYLAEVAIISNR